MSAPRWRDVLEIHPAADLFPVMSEAELKVLGEDIRKHGIRTPVVLWSPPDNKREFLIDGRNRLDAAAMAGLLEVDEHGRLCLRTWDGLREIRYQRYGTGNLYDNNPYALAVSLNIHRRHLTGEKKRELIAKLLKAKPESSNVTIAKQVKADDKTVAKVRRESQVNLGNSEVGENSRRRRQGAQAASKKAAADRGRFPAGCRREAGRRDCHRRAR